MLWVGSVFTPVISSVSRPRSIDLLGTGIASILLLHFRAMSWANRYASRVKILKAKDVHAKVVRRHALSVERVYPANTTEMVLGCVRVEHVRTKRLTPGEEPKC